MVHPIKVLIADDHAAVREAVRVSLETENDMQVVGEASNGIGALKYVRENCPDVIIMDYSMPGMNGVEAARLIRQEFPQIGVVFLLLSVICVRIPTFGNKEF